MPAAFGSPSSVMLLLAVAVGLFGVRQGWRGLRTPGSGMRRTDGLILLLGGGSFLVLAALAAIR